MIAEHEDFQDRINELTNQASSLMTDAQNQFQKYIKDVKDPKQKAFLMDQMKKAKEGNLDVAQFKAKVSEFK